MKKWRVVLEFPVYHAETEEDVRALLPILTGSHDPFHTEILPKAKIYDESDKESEEPNGNKNNKT